MQVLIVTPEFPPPRGLTEVSIGSQKTKPCHACTTSKTWHCQDLGVCYEYLMGLVEPMGIEPTTFALRTRRSPS
jgi:hypothetical protein